MKEIELYTEPRDIILPKLTKIEGEPQMTEFESAFLCGMLKKFRPHKIVEVGVAAGATTAIIMQCMTELGVEFEIHSVDILNVFNRDLDQENPRICGFMAEEAKKILGNIKYVPHFGSVVASSVEEIGGGRGLCNP